MRHGAEVGTLRQARVAHVAHVLDSKNHKKERKGRTAVLLNVEQGQTAVEPGCGSMPVICGRSCAGASAVGQPPAPTAKEAIETQERAACWLLQTLCRNASCTHADCIFAFLGFSLRPGQLKGLRRVCRTATCFLPVLGRHTKIDAAALRLPSMPPMHTVPMRNAVAGTHIETWRTPAPGHNCCLNSRTGDSPAPEVQVG